MKLEVSSLGNKSFKRLKLKFPTGETMVSVQRNQRFQCMKLLVLLLETKCFFKMRKYSANLLKFK
ncbi:hypothetical protein DW080_12020 [Bacteroides caccae]|nr:hypothetical protein DW080_12020 [Bacteroides caccae]